MARKGKKRVSTSNRTPNENEAAEDALVETENSDLASMEQTEGFPNGENKETASEIEDKEIKHEERNVISKKSEETLEDDKDSQELNGHNMTEEDQNSEKPPEGDEDNESLMEEDDEGDQEDSMEESDEEDTSEEENEENEIFEDEDSEDASSTFEDEDTEEDAAEEEGEEERKDDIGGDAEEEKEVAEADSGKAEECNEEKIGALMKEKAKKSEEINREVKENSNYSHEVREEDRMNDKEDKGVKEDNENAKGDEQNAEKNNAEKLETSLKEKVKKERQRSRRKKVGEGSSKEVAPGAEDKPESSSKKKSKKRAESMGMIFMCSSQTKNDCYRYRVLGLPASKKDLVKKIYKGMRLFLYDIDLKLMYGIYKAAGTGGYNIEPKAFKSQFPSQVRFTVFEDCLPLAEEKFKTVIKENYFTKNKFNCQLTSTQVKKLCKLFVPAKKVKRSKKLGRRAKAEIPPRVPRERRLQRRGDNKPPTVPRESRLRRRVDDETPRRRERNGRWIRDDGRRSSLREEDRNHERPRKRRRDAVTPPPVAVTPQWHPPPLVAPPPLPPPQPVIIPSYAYRTPEVNVYRLEPPLDDRDPYRARPDPYFDRRDPYRVGLDPYTEHRGSSRDGRRLVPQDTYRRDPILEHPDGYRQDRLVDYRDSYSRDSYGRDSYSRDEMLDYRDRRLSNLETRRQDEIGSRDPYTSYGDGRSSYETRRRDEIGGRGLYVSYQDHPSYAGPMFVTEPREYRLAGPTSDHVSTRGPLPEYRPQRTLPRY